MPQLVKGGKYVFGWSLVNLDGRIRIPTEAGDEYHFKPGNKVFLLSGSKTSGGFSLTRIDLIRSSPFYSEFRNIPEMSGFKTLESGYIEHKKRIFSWTEVDKKGYIVPRQEVLLKYSVFINDRLLVVRGSGLALGFIKTGPIVKKAEQHPELTVFK